MNATLERRISGVDGTFGLFSWDGQEGDPLFSGELPWRNNQPDISCIPAGIYTCVKTFSPHFNCDVYHVMNVPGRDAVEIHPANYMGDTSKGLRSDLEGCLSLGLCLQTLRHPSQIGLLESQLAIQRFESAMADQPFQLTVLAAD